MIGETTAWCEQAATELAAGNPQGAGLLEELDAMRRGVEREIWRGEVIPRIRSHPIYALTQECPFSRRATDKPRGYAGDALLLDFLYRRPSVAPFLDSSTELGTALCDYWVGSPAAAAVRARRDHVRGRIVRRMRDPYPPEILSVACGHLTELIDGDLPPRGRLGRVVALDQDERSLRHVERYGDIPSLELRHARIKDLLKGDPDERFDLIYAAGLYDYLGQGLARALTQRLFARLRPGGELVVGNFLPGTPNIASMEAFQDWFLVYRTRQEIEDLAHLIDPREIAHQRYDETADGCIGILSLERA